MDPIERIFELVDNYFKDQKDFADAIGVKPQRVSEWRKRKSASYTKRLPEIARVLGTTTEYLLTGADPDASMPPRIIRRRLSAEAMAVAEAFDLADERSRAIVRMTLGVEEDLPIAARGGRVIKKPSPSNAETLDRLSKETQQAADLENDQY